MPSFRITNLPQFEAQLNAKMKDVSSNVFDTLSVEAQKLFQRIPQNIAQSPEFQDLKTGEKIRGQLGLALPGRKGGGDTDAEDLLNILKEYKVIKSKSSGVRKLSITFPDLSVFESRLLHNLSSIKRGQFMPGSRVSWFRWWEFGDRGEIDSLTITPANASILTRSNFRRVSSESSILAMIKKLSRSGFALQSTAFDADASSHILGRGLIGRTYANYLRIFPAHMSRAIKQYVVNARGVVR